MAKFIIEREMPGVGGMGEDEVRGVSRTVVDATEALGDVEWVESYVAGDKTFCVFEAPDAERLREHASRAGLPVSRVHEVVGVIGPHTAAAGEAGPPAETEGTGEVPSREMQRGLGH